ncbi:glycosyltransferase [Ramlibacter sp. PS4R-6]|uniref:glycosyltransferase n=1 Tax=Ramlibacter sp. PS4R-6 TaxID=3133438 RepID=UPI0030ABB192
MSGRRVLVLGSYPAVNPRHGGQVRLSQVAQAYAARGFDVKQASFFPAHAFYTDSRMGPADVPLPVQSLRLWRGEPSEWVEDLASGEVAAATPARVEALERYAVQADVVHLEQPWLLPLVERLRERGRIGAFRLVYGSQNIEHELKRAILRQNRVHEEEDIAGAVQALERRCAEQAALVAAVTAEDAAVLAGWTRAPIVLAPNGIAPWTSDPARRQRWSQRIGPAPFALYVGSAHPPNVQGFCDCFGASLAALSPIHRVVIAGHVSEFILRTPWFKEWKSLNERRTVAVGVLSQEDLSAVRDLAHAFLLPVTAGGGSNLKTAEALYSGKHVVASPLAMRGFEGFAGLPGLRVEAPGHAFAAAVADVLEAPARPVERDAREQRDSLTWQHTLRALGEAAEGVVAP